MYDYMLGGKDNYAADREAADAIIASDPGVPATARANRAFAARATKDSVKAGIVQYVDIGCGIPTEPSVFSAAWGVRPEALVVGVDNDPVVLTHGRARTSIGQNGVQIVEGDVRKPGAILVSLDRLVDWERPVAVLLVAVLHFVRDAEDPAAIVTALRDRMTPGSRLILSHASSDGTPAPVKERIESVYGQASAPLIFRTDRQIAGFFDRFALVEPGLFDVAAAVANEDRPAEDRVRVAAGVGVVA